MSIQKKKNIDAPKFLPPIHPFYHRGHKSFPQSEIWKKVFLFAMKLSPNTVFVGLKAILERALAKKHPIHDH